MTEIENFLNKNICKYLIDYYESYQGNLKQYGDRKIIQLLQIKVDDNIVKDVIEVYRKIRPNQNLNNIELICWPGKGYHDWHDDTIYYDHTTITYLNDDYVGGKTLVGDYEVQPSVGKLIIFNSKIKHKVTNLEKNNRYVIVAWYTNADRK
tara:strand:+ start:407 stop:859 length:453 start_codon:yes stop_codon:yes gene_type:complete